VPKRAPGRCSNPQPRTATLRRRRFKTKAICIVSILLTIRISSLSLPSVLASRAENPSAVFCALLLGLATSLSTRGWSAEPREYRVARSVHLSYPAPPARYFYNEVTVMESVNGSYFMACGWNTGYFGIQQLDGPDDKVVLFSVWDPTTGDDPASVKTEDRVEVLYQGDGVRIKRFGGEGTGGQCMWKCNWALGNTNRFVVGAEPQGNKCAFTAWFWADGSWKKLATFRTRTALPMSGYYSFIEDFRRDGKSALESRRARFGNGWLKTVDGNWQALPKAKFTASNSQWESKDNIDAGAEQGMFYLATGGRIQRSRELNSMVELPRAASDPPKQLLDLVAQSSASGPH
jgi:hypothetical protein